MTQLPPRGTLLSRDLAADAIRVNTVCVGLGPDRTPGAGVVLVADRDGHVDPA